MNAFRLACLLAVFAFLFSCSIALTPDERVALAQTDKLPLYFSGSDSAPAAATEKIGPVNGYSCKTAWFGSSVSEEEALKNLWGNASAQKATAAVNVACAPIKFFTPQVGCWPGVYCMGDAVK
jgi:hypothetical protein